MSVVRPKLKDHEAKACGVILFKPRAWLGPKLKDHEAKACGVIWFKPRAWLGPKLKDHEAKASGVRCGVNRGAGLHGRWRELRRSPLSRLPLRRASAVNGVARRPGPPGADEQRHAAGQGWLEVGGTRTSL